jgi:hypothetical protein
MKLLFCLSGGDQIRGTTTKEERAHKRRRAQQEAESGAFGLPPHL